PGPRRSRGSGPGRGVHTAERGRAARHRHVRAGRVHPGRPRSGGIGGDRAGRDGDRDDPRARPRLRVTRRAVDRRRALPRDRSAVLPAHPRARAPARLRARGGSARRGHCRGARDRAGVRADPAFPREGRVRERVRRRGPPGGSRRDADLLATRASEYALAPARRRDAGDRAGDRVGLGVELPRARRASPLAGGGRDAQRWAALPHERVVAHRCARARDHRHRRGDDDPRAATHGGAAGVSAHLTRVRGLTVSCPGVGTVVRDVDLDLEPGRCVAVVGGSGAGKSVLARALVGLAGEGGAPATVEARELLIAGEQMRGAGPRTWRAIRGTRVGFVLQDALQSLDPLRRIGAEVGEALDVQRPRLSRLEREQRVVDALTQAGLPDATRQLRRRSEELSGGMRQRALIASAICSSPALLIADEPTTALDATVAAGVLDLLGDLRDQGSAVLLITHDLGAAQRIADDVVVLDGGEIVERGPISQVFAAPAHPAARALLAAVPRGPRPTSARAEAAPPILTAGGLRRAYRIPGETRLRPASRFPT